MKLDKKGLEQLKNEIERVDAQLREAKLKKGHTFSDNRNSWQDNAEYDQAKLAVDGLAYQLSNLRRVLHNVTLVSAHNAPERVDIGDVVTLYNRDADDRFKVLLTANYMTDLNAEDDDEISIISVNSPIGEAIFGKEKGERTIALVNDRKIEVEIEDFEKQTCDEIAAQL